MEEEGGERREFQRGPLLAGDGDTGLVTLDLTDVVELRDLREDGHHGAVLGGVGHLIPDLHEPLLHCHLLDPLANVRQVEWQDFQPERCTCNYDGLVQSSWQMCRLKCKSLYMFRYVCRSRYMCTVQVHVHCAGAGAGAGTGAGAGAVESTGSGAGEGAGAGAGAGAGPAISY